MLKSLLSAFTQTQNVPTKLRGRYQMKFSRESQPLYVLGDFSFKTQLKNLKNFAIFSNFNSFPSSSSETTEDSK